MVMEGCESGDRGMWWDVQGDVWVILDSTPLLQWQHTCSASGGTPRYRSVYPVSYFIQSTTAAPAMANCIQGKRRGQQQCRYTRVHNSPQLIHVPGGYTLIYRVWDTINCVSIQNVTEHLDVHQLLMTLDGQQHLL